jgi:hypothetical protein
VLNKLRTTPWIHMGELRYSVSILDIGIRWKSMVRFTPRPLYPPRKESGTHWIGGWVGPRAGLWTLWSREKFLLHTPWIEPRTSKPSPVAIETELPMLSRNVFCFLVLTVFDSILLHELSLTFYLMGILMTDEMVLIRSSCQGTAEGDTTDWEKA